MPTQLEQLQAELVAAANAVPPDIDRIQGLTNKINQLDTDNVRFTVDAGIISRLGQELVGKQETAVAELIKNAYDADATEVRIVFADTNAPGGTLLIEDNGSGMTRDQLLNGFMRLSSNDKLLHPESERYLRRRAGRKGIGRFAVQRLGEELVLTTQTEGATKALRVTVDWEAFRAGRDLGTITSRIEEVDKDRPYGTVLFIKKLRESWSNAEQRRVYRYVSELLQPFPLTKFKKSVYTQKTDRQIGEAGRFDVKLIQQDDSGETVVASQEETIFANSIAVIEGYVDQNGKGTWSIESKKLGLKEEISAIGLDRENKKPFPNLRNVSLKAYYFIWLPDLFSKLLFSTLQEIGRNQGGIRVFRNGFRVSPYGDKDNDWLQLDASYGGRKILSPHANVNFIGLIELNDYEGNLFEERSSREGLIENNAFRELQDFAYRVLVAGVLRVAEIRERKGTASQAGWQQKPDVDPADALRDAAERLRKAAQDARDRRERETASDNNKDNQPNTGSENNNSNNPNSENSNAADDDFSEFDKVADDIDEAASNARQLIQENQMLRVLASLGLIIAEFTHEIGHVVGAAQQNSDALNKIANISEQEKYLIEQLGVNINRLSDYSSFFYKTVASNARRELAPQNLRAVGRQFEEYMAASIQRSGVAFEFEPDGYELYTPPMHTSEINSILLNFYSNSLKAIRRAGAQGRMLLRVGEENKRVFLEFSDNGDGIPDVLHERIFNAFFTTATPASRDSTAAEEAQGSGLGLKIVSDIAAVYGGDVFVTTPPDNYATCIRVEFPAYQPDE